MMNLWVELNTRAQSTTRMMPHLCLSYLKKQPGLHLLSQLLSLLQVPKGRGTYKAAINHHTRAIT